MWYCMQIGAGMEEKISRYCETELDKKQAGHSFIFYYETQMKLSGAWKNVQKITFPGLVFYSSEQEDKLLDALKVILGLPGIVRVGRDLTRLSADEIKFLEELGGTNHVMEMSVGAIEGDRLKILSGPLSRLDCNKIKKINRHKRMAYMKADLFGSIDIVPVGLEVKTKTA